MKTDVLATFLSLWWNTTTKAAWRKDGWLRLRRLASSAAGKQDCMKQAWLKSGRLRAHILSHSVKQRKPSEAVGQKSTPPLSCISPIGRRSKRGCSVLCFESGVSVVLQWSKNPHPNHMHERGSGQMLFKIYASMTKTHKTQLHSITALPIGRGAFSLTNLEFSMMQLEKLNKL